MTKPLARVLLADDHHAILRGVRSHIESSGRFKVVGEANGGRDAHRLARELKPDIAVIDYSLPEMNGLDLATAIKRDSPNTEIVFFTIHDGDKIIASALKAGVRGYVVKMDPEEHVLAALDALAAGRPYFSPTVSDAVLKQFVDTKPIASVGPLTQREREIVQLIAEGCLNKEIASRLGITVKTVETHRSTAMRKLKIRTTADVVRWAVRNNLIEP